jgi:ergothioneine biosynthesis protein EgtB
MIDREEAVRWYRENRERSDATFAIVRPEAYYERPIALRNPICFYEGHLPAFSVNTLIRRGLKEPGIDEDYEVLFERGIDPDDETGVGNHGLAWPSRDAIRAYGGRADRRIVGALEGGAIEQADDPVLRRGLAVYTILEHEPMHQETLRYMWHRLPLEKKIRPAGAPPMDLDGEPPARGPVTVPAGVATLGTGSESRFGWDNEYPQHRVEVPAFDIDVYDVTNRDYLEFLEAGGYDRPDLWDEEGWEWRSRAAVRHPLFWEQSDGGWLWQGMFERVALPPAWPVYVSHAEAQAYARWRGRRLPTEAEFHRAAYGTPEGVERSFPWGEEPPDATRGNFGFSRYDPVPVGRFPRGASAWGIHDLVGNGWEWTSTVFSGFDGFQAMPSYPNYSADFFDGKHWVLKGASPATARELVRRGFRNWFRGNYPYVYATFRTVSPSR